MNQPTTIFGFPWLLRNMELSFIIVASLFATLYWGLIASDRYISEAHVLIQSTDSSSSSSPDIASLMKGGSGASIDQMLLRDYLLSTDMLKLLDDKLKLREHYTNPRLDPLSRMWYHSDTFEGFHDYYLEHVSIEFDNYSGVLVLLAQGFDPNTAQAIANELVSAGEEFMNRLARDLAHEQIDFLETDINRIAKKTQEARQEVIRFQNDQGLVSPESTTENLNAIINRLESQLADLQTTRAGMLGYLMANSANIRELDLQIAATEKQIASEKAKLTSPSSQSLNRTVEEYQRLVMLADFSQEIYKAALTSLEQGRYQASRTLKKMAVLQTPTLPQYPIEPRRVYNISVFILTILLVAGIMHLVAAIVRDHKD